jgi:hypothetical protein
MISKRRITLTAFAAVAVIAGGVFTLVAPASVVERPSFQEPRAIDNVTIRPWGEDLSGDAVDAVGIERDLDGNASALIPLDRLLEEIYRL